MPFNKRQRSAPATSKDPGTLKENVSNYPINLTILGNKEPAFLCWLKDCNQNVRPIQEALLCQLLGAGSQETNSKQKLVTLFNSKNGIAKEDYKHHSKSTIIEEAIVRLGSPGENCQLGQSITVN